MDLPTFFAHDSNLLYTGAAAGILALFVLELISVLVGFSLSADKDIHWDHDMHADGIADWLGFGAVPLLVFLIVLLTNFAFSGWIINFAALHSLGDLLPTLLTAPFAAIAAAPGTRYVNRTISRWIPNTESNAVALEDLLGRSAVIVVGTATDSMAAPARCMDQHGQQHNILVRSNDPENTIAQGSTVRLERIVNNVFYATQTETGNTYNV